MGVAGAIQDSETAPTSEEEKVWHILIISINNGLVGDEEKPLSALTTVVMAVD